MDAKTNLKSGQLTLGDKNWSFPLYEGTIGPEVIDISKLYAEAGIFEVLAVLGKAESLARLRDQAA